MKQNVRDKSFIILILILCLGFFSTSYAEKKFEVGVDIGFDGHIKPSELTPVRIEIKDNFKDIEGKVQLLIYQKHNDKSFFTAYSKDINIAKGSTKIINMECTFKKNDLLYVRIVDKNEKVVFEKMIRYLQMSRPDSAFMGIFSENPDSLRYLSKTYNKNSSGSNVHSFFEIANLDETLPENYKILKMFRTIVINNYDSEKLNEKQKEALKKWIEDGGLLLLGTGPNYQKTLSGFEDINFLDIEGTKEKSIAKFASAEPIKLINTSLKDGQQIIIDSNKELEVYHKQLGKGHIVVTGFDMGLSPFNNWDGKEKFINDIINKYVNYDVGNYDVMESHWFNNIISFLPYNLLPSPTSILIILVLFILIVGPVNYFVLKKIDKREFLWITIPIIVVLFSASIYVLGFKTRLRQPITNNVSIINIDNETNTAIVNSKSGIMGFKNGTWDVVMDVDSEVILDGRRNYEVIQRFAEGEIVTENYSNKDKHIIFNKASILDVETIGMNREMKLNDKVMSDIVIKDGKLVGKVNNISNLKLEDMVIFYGNKYEKLENFKEGEVSKKFEIDINKNNINGTIKDWYSIMDSLYGSRRKSQENQNGDNILNNNIKREIFQGLLDFEQSMIRKNRFFMIAWNKEKITNDIIINGKETKSIDRNLVLIPLTIKYEKGEEINIPYGVLYPQIEDNYNMHLEKNGGILYGEGYVVFKFKPEENIELTSMKIDINNSTNNYEIFIYNFKEDEWEKWNERDLLIDHSNKDKYYQSDRGTLLKYDPSKDFDIYIPTFKVEGVIK